MIVLYSRHVCPWSVLPSKYEVAAVLVTADASGLDGKSTFGQIGTEARERESQPEDPFSLLALRLRARLVPDGGLTLLLRTDGG
jgi:hypothetical protein